MPLVSAGNVNVNFPFEPYDCQLAYMEKVIQCLREGVNGILESPTGTGKTLCLLCSSLAWLEDKKAQITSKRWNLASGDVNSVLSEAKETLAQDLDSAAGSWAGELGAPKIIYASRTHSQLSQAINELKRTAYSHFKVCVLGSREQLCIHPVVSQELSNTTKVHMCRAKVMQRSCHFYNNKDATMHQFSNQLLDIEDLVKLGQKHSTCPYYASRELKAEADIIFMPYNYLLDPKSRRAHGVELQGTIVIFDEAHNLEKICEDSTSFDLRSVDIAAAIRELTIMSEKIMDIASNEDQACDMGESQVVSEDFNITDILELKAMMHSLEEALDKIHIPDKSKGLTKPGKYIFEMLSEVNLTFQTKSRVSELLEKMVSYLTNEGSHGAFSSKGAGLSKISDVIKIVFSRNIPEGEAMSYHEKLVSRHYKVHISVETPNPHKKKSGTWDTSAPSAKTGRMLSYWCFSPGHAMEELQANGVRCIILTSGTLSPMSSFKTEMGVDFKVELENPHVIEPHQVWLGTICRGPDNTELNSSYEHRFREDYQCSLGNAVVNFARTVPNGLLLFFPSYPVMDQCLATWEQKNIFHRIAQYKPIFREPKNKHEFHTAMTTFYEKIHDPALNGAIFAAVCRGKVSEGLDFSDINGRAVVITGLPFPPRMDPKVVHKMQYLDEAKPLPGQAKKLTGQEWYRQQATRAVNQAIGRVIRHRQDYGAIILCDKRFSSPASVSQLPSWLRSHVKNYNSFGNALRDIMGFFKHAEKTMPAPTFGKRGKPKTAGSLGCQGASFEPSISSSSSSSLQRGIERASKVEQHVHSLKTSRGIDREEVSLARLKIQYESNDGASATQNKPRSLLDALSSNEKSQNDTGFSDTQIPSFQKQSNLLQEKLKPKKKIVLKERSSSPVPSTSASETKDSTVHIKRDKLNYAERYISAVKASLSKENYVLFSKTLTTYKKTQDFETMMAVLADMFLDDDHRTQLFRRFYCFVRPQHKEKFNKTLTELTGKGCLPAEGASDGPKPVASSTASKRTSSSTEENDGDKKRKLNSGSAGIASTSETDKAGSSLPLNGVSSKQGNSNLNKPMTGCGEPKRASSSSDETPSSQGSMGSNDLFKESSESSPSDFLQSSGSKDGVGSGVDNDTKKSGDNDNRVSEKPAADVDPQKPAETVLPLDGLTDTQRYILTCRTNENYKCESCKKVAFLPLKALCHHICCMACWKDLIKETGKCPNCEVKVKRRHLSRLVL